MRLSTAQPRSIKDLNAHIKNLDGEYDSLNEELAKASHADDKLKPKS